MIEGEELAEVLASLSCPDADERSAVLLVLWEDPTGDGRVRAAIESLIDDRTVCRAQPPADLTEVRYYAAYALAAERKAAGIQEPVRISAVVLPIEAAMLSKLAEDAYGERAMPRSARDRFERLRADGKIPTRDLSL